MECVGEGGVLEVCDFDEATGVGTDEERVVGMEGQSCDAVCGVVFYAINLCKQKEKQLVDL